MQVTRLTRAALAACVQVTLPGGGLWYDNLDGRTIDAAQDANRNFRWACSAASTAFWGGICKLLAWHMGRALGLAC